MAVQLADYQADAGRLRTSLDDINARDQSLANERNADTAALTGWAQSIEQRLAAGTTRGNPDLVIEWQRAETALTALDRSMATLTQLSVQSAQAVALGNYLGSEIKAAIELQGATDEEHATLLALGQSVAQSTDGARALAQHVRSETDQQAQALDAEHRELTQLRHSIDIGVLIGKLGAAR